MTKVAVVDGANDLDLFELADPRVSFNAQKIVRDKADLEIQVKDLKVLPETIRNALGFRKLGYASVKKYPRGITREEKHF